MGGRVSVAMAVWMVVGIARVAAADGATTLPMGVRTQAGLDALVKKLEAPRERMGALREIVEAGRWELYRVGSVFTTSGDPEVDAVWARAAKVARAAADLPTVTAALDSGDREVQFYGVWMARGRLDGEEAERWRGLLPRIEKLAAEGEAGVRLAAVETLQGRAQYRTFLERRAAVETNLFVVARLVYDADREVFASKMNAAAVRLLDGQDAKARDGVIGHIASTPGMAEMWQVRYDGEVLKRVLRMAESKVEGERAGAAWALGAMAGYHAAAVEMLLKLAEDGSEEVRWRAIWGMRDQRENAAVAAAIAKHVRDASGNVALWAILADGWEKHRAELEGLAKGADEKVAQAARVRLGMFEKTGR